MTIERDEWGEPSPDEPTAAYDGEPVQVPEAIDPGGNDAAAIARLAASTWLHGTEWGLMTSARMAGRLARSVTDPDEAHSLVQDLGRTAHAVSDVTRSLSAGAPLPEILAQIGDSFGEIADPVRPRDEAQPPRRSPSLRERGAELLERSRDVWSTDTTHPAYARILEELAPDEARILLLLVRDGAQPSVDVRTGGAVGMVSSTLIKPDMTMIGPRAGCRYVDNVPSYLHNLSRLGLVWFSRELVEDPTEYQVLEAQPDVLEQMRTVRHAKAVRRSISLTPFGEDFCRAVLDEPAG